MENNIQTLVNIGPYIAERFITHSVWNGRNVPIQNLQQLQNFLVRRANNVSEIEAKEKFSEWLKFITKNQRNSQCLDDQRYRRVIDGVERKYKIREFNYYAFNAVVDFWNAVIQPNLRYQNKNIRSKIPRKVTQLGIRNKYPLQCRIEE